MLLTRVLDVLGMLTAFAAAWFWLRASDSRLRRVSRFETLDAADLNRLVVIMNRNQILNTRGALAAAASALLVGARIAADLLARL